MIQRETVVRMICALFVLLFPLSLFAACSEKLEENQIAVEWHRGIVTSSEHESPMQLLDGQDGYSYSDVIHLEKAGAKLTFTDWNTEDMPDTEWAGADVLVLSHWVEQDGTWVLENPGDNYPGAGGRANEIVEVRMGEYAQYTYISSFDDEYVRLCYKSGHTDKNARKLEFAKVYVEQTNKPGTLAKNAEAVTALKVEKYLAESRKNNWNAQLNGLTIYIMGDSYFDDPEVEPYMWINFLEEKYDLTVENYAKSGSSVSNFEGGRNPMCDRISKMPDGSPDIVLFHGGRNDFNLVKAPLGEKSLDNVDEATFCGGVNSCFTQLREKYPNALILAFTCWRHEQVNVNGDHQVDFADALRDMCALWGIPCFYQADEDAIGIYMDDPNFRAKYCKRPTDISHLNMDGMMMYMPKPERFIADEYAKFLAAR